MKYSYVVIGAGRQGTAAAYDMAKWGEASSVIVADMDLDIASKSAHRVNLLLKKEIVHPTRVNVTDEKNVQDVIRGADACLSAVPYYLNLHITNSALKAGVNLCDLGGNIDIARKQHEFDHQAREAGISIIPNCGQVPGLGTTLMVRSMELLDEPIDVWMWDGGLPQKPRLPFQYLLTFNIEGLTNEYAEPAIFLRNGEVTEIAPISEPEFVDFPDPIGRLEAFVAGGGTDTMPWTYHGKLRTLQNKTLRHPGHFAQLRAFYDLGLWRIDPVHVKEAQVVPRDLFHALFEPLVTFPEDRDMVLMRVKAAGKKDDRPAESIVDLIDYFDDETGFSAMERCTGWSAAIVAEMMAKDLAPHGAGGVETMVPAKSFIDELKRRQIVVTESIRFV
jgi:lysine 6-dehydrogenase